MDMREAQLRGFRAGGRAKLVGQLMLAGLAIYLIVEATSGRMSGFDLSELGARLAEMPVHILALAAICAVISISAFAAYDVLAFRALGVRAPIRTMMKSGVTATGLGQTLGFGLIVGGFARWRMMRDHGVTPAKAAGATGIVTLGFFFGVAAVGSVAAFLSPDAIANALLVTTAEVRGAAMLGFAVFLGALILSVRVGGPGRGPKVLLAQVTLAALDLAPAALALWLLLPASAGVGFSEVFIAYIAALALGLLSNTPGGVGVFEGVLLIALPLVPSETLVATIIAFRAIFYGAPFLIAAFLLGDKETGQRATAALGKFAARFAAKPIPTQVVPAQAVSLAVAQSERAESHLAFLGDKKFLFTAKGDGFLMYGSRFGALVAIGDPVGPRRAWPELIDNFIDLADEHGKTPVLYKTGAVVGALCRSRGMMVDCIGHEAVIDPQTFTLSGAPRRQLRRKVKQAEKAGVELHWRAAGEADFAAIAEISQVWGDRKGGEAGFSMGRFSKGYLSRFPVVEARLDGRLVGFVSLWQSGDDLEWSVDLMRASADAPMGTMQMLISGAIDAARDAGADRFNMCMSPMSGLEGAESRVERTCAWVYATFGERLGLHGLHRFKASFTPEWQPRYMVREPGIAAVLAPLATRSLITSPPKMIEG